ncbi:2-phospho-L-lactate transferase [Ahrensia marina]|uniref:2-phospho-L-lactate transferase n=1 Tax=Ahrensia marina TaxID=1514904 RepID=UPI0035CF4CF7
MTLLAGGVGGAKMAEGLAALDDVELTIIGNIADDEQFHGLWVSPDIDTVTYTLAGMIDRSQGWGVADEGLRALGVLEALGEHTWMTLGDKDLGLHIYRTMRRHEGDRPSDIARHIAKAFGVKPTIVLPTDDWMQTRLVTDIGPLSFQEYFVREKCKPEVQEIWFEGVEFAKPTPEALDALEKADLIVFAPSNPLVSIDPILAIPGVHDAVVEAPASVIAVSPLIAGKTVKGPASRMMESLGLEASALGVARHYQGLVDTLVIDTQDAELQSDIEALGMEVSSTDILMPTLERKREVAAYLLEVML